MSLENNEKALIDELHKRFVGLADTAYFKYRANELIEESGAKTLTEFGAILTQKILDSEAEIKGLINSFESYSPEFVFRLFFALRARMLEEICSLQIFASGTIEEVKAHIAHIEKLPERYGIPEAFINETIPFKRAKNAKKGGAANHDKAKAEEVREKWAAWPNRGGNGQRKKFAGEMEKDKSIGVRASTIMRWIRGHP